MKKIAFALLILVVVVLCACAHNDDNSFGLTVSEQLELARNAEAETEENVISEKAPEAETTEAETTEGETTETVTTEAVTTELESTPIITSVESETYAQNTNELTYVLNINKKSMKFHYPDCGSVANMKAENRVDFYGTRDEAIAMGHSPCGNCKP